MKKLATFLLSLFLIFSLAACSVSSAAPATTSAGEQIPVVTQVEQTGTAVTVESAAEAIAENSSTHDDDGDYQWDSASATTITLNGNTITTDGDGVTIDGSKATITSAGTYSISGSLADGQIVVNTDDDEIVRLLFNGIDIHSSTSAPIYIAEAEETVIVLGENTTNTVSDGSSYVFENPDEEEPNAVIFSKSDLTIYGGGSLSVTGSFADGITSKDGLVVAGGAITVSAADDGIRGKDYLVVKDGSITVTAQGDGLKADNEEDAAKGYISIENGTLNITAAGDALNAATDIVIAGGTFALSSGGGSGSQADESVSAKGIKGAVSIIIDGGAFTIDSADDAIHSNSSVVINNGTFDLASGDDGIHADASIELNGGEMNIRDSYEGIESAVIILNGGSLHVSASDDGVNIAGGVDSSGMGQGGGLQQDAFASSGSRSLYINGGYLYVDAAGDGLDVNGAVEMTGGTVLVNGPTQQMNGALDYDAGFKISGGLLVAVGSAGMAQAPDSSSSQYSLLINLDSTQPAGSLIHIQSSSGENVLTFSPTKQYQSIAFSSPDLANGETYSVSLGGSSSGTSADGLYLDGAYTGGAQNNTLTISSVVTMVGNVRGGPGGRRPR